MNEYIKSFKEAVEKLEEDYDLSYGRYLGSLVRNNDDYQFYKYPNDYIEIVHADYNKDKHNIYPKNLNTKGKAIEMIFRLLGNGYSYSNDAGALGYDDQGRAEWYEHNHPIENK